MSEPESIVDLRAEILLLRREVSKLLQIALDQSADAKRWKTSHDAMRDRCSILRQRPDLPVERIPAYEALVKAQEKAIENEGMAECMVEARGELIDAGIIDKSTPPMFVAEAVINAVLKAASKVALCEHDEPTHPNHPGHHDGHTCEAIGKFLGDLGSQRHSVREAATEKMLDKAFPALVARNTTFGLDDNGKPVLNNAPAPTEQAERQLFEAAYARLHRCTPSGGWSDRSSASGNYEEVDTQDAWILWNAAIAARQACKLSKSGYRKAVNVLNQLLDAGGADEDHPLAGLVTIVGALIGDYEDATQVL